ncbi:MAG TPA: hypothetical protein DHV28_16480 [Ignavibacteriales bacterium]|nr:hypothetical protein [Ignavibacteriales bacterium]
MIFEIVLGIPDVETYWNELDNKYQVGKLSGKEKTRFNKLIKAFRLLESNPRSNSLATHEIDALSIKYGFKVFQSYLENKVPSAGRIFWAYGPDKGQITILAIEPHPEMKSRTYSRIRLAKFPDRRKKK